MQIIRRKAAHKDARGTITDVLENNRVECVTMLTTVKGGVRGNHYHKKTTQYTYIMKGRVRVFTQVVGERVQQRLMRAGDLLITPPKTRHAFVALEDSVYIACAHGPRRSTEYESDTYRLEVPLYPRPK